MESDEARTLAANIEDVRARIARAAQRAGRDPGEVTVVAVSKTLPAERVALACWLGLAEVGENRVQEAAGKIPLVTALLGGDSLPRWHLVGHLQTNKVREALRLFHTIESVDSLRLAQRLSEEAGRLGRRVRVLLEVNVGREPQKNGLLPENVVDVAADVVDLADIEIVGLMTVAPLVPDAEAVRPVFRALRRLRDRLRDEVPAAEWRHLSMGMTDDYEVAVEEGATIVRLGRAIFGARA